MTPALHRHAKDRRRAPLFGILSALTLYYAFVVTAGTFQTLHWTSQFYDWLAEGMLAGHLYIPVEPDPVLLARDNPYDWNDADDWDAWLWDASLYKGRYYIYWGPLPALCLLLVKLVTRYTGTIHDQWLVLFFMLLRLYAGSALILAFARSQNPRLPDWALYLALLVFGLASPTPYFLARPLVYEASIAAGQGCLFLGLFCAFQGLSRPLTQARWFVAAGCCWGGALASRGSLIITAPLLIMSTAWCAQRPAGFDCRFGSRGHTRSLVRSLLALGAPVGVSLALYALYNQLRFDAFYEFGLTYQLTGRPFGTDNRYMLPNLVSYLASQVRWSCEFPFASLPQHRKLPQWIHWPDDYDIGDADNGERAGGILIATTICWLWSVWLYRGVVLFKRKTRGEPSGARAPIALSTAELWLVLCSLSCIAALAPAARMWMANMRFLQDAAGGIVLGAIGAALWLLRPVPARDRARTRPRRWLGPGVFIGLALHTIFVGVCLGFTGYMNSFSQENRALFERLEHSLSVCSLKQQLLKLRSIQAFAPGALPVAWPDAPRRTSRPQGRTTGP